MSEPIKPFSHTYWMQFAYREAEKAFEEGEVPVGAIVVVNNHIIGRGHNMCETLQDATAHAEILAITAASEHLKSWRLDEATLYVTLEPCPMCAGAMINARVKTVIYGLEDAKAGACDSLYHLCEDPRLNHHVKVLHGYLREQIHWLMTEFFKKLRN
ncbi:MAG: tRNA adenosine(34) deaminase TadA [Candidatus Marinimicrobia bacterium]|nr:tRNA adenosine(34) deaminase TadA [Candidatus Neomarinimicrobiota bacterium]MDD5581825.1 tRNA adenosine(34) deaminase TadA [Candidatus Neomarinimicrobiota bacterium]